MSEKKEYLGDGLYAHCDGWHIWLTTPQGNEVALEPRVYEELVRYAKRVWAPAPTTPAQNPAEGFVPVPGSAESHW